MPESLKDTTVKGVGWSALDTIANYGITFLVGLVLARLLSPEDYGLIGIIGIFITIFNSIVDGGFFNALVRKPDANDSDFSTVFYLNLFVSLFLALSLYFSAPLIAHFFKREELISLTRAMSIIVIVNAMAIVPKARLTIKIDFKSQTKVSIISSTVSGVVGIGMAFLKCGVWSLVGQQLSRQVINTLFLWGYSSWIPKLFLSSKSFKEMFGFGWKIMFSNLLDSIWKEISQVVIGRVYSPYTLGQYSRASQFAGIFSNNLTTIVQRVSYPVLSTIQNETERMVAAYRRIIKMSMLLTCVLMFGLVAVARPMVLVLIGDQWLPCVPYLQLICFSMMLYPLHSINLNMLQILGRSDIYLYLEIIKKVLAIGPILLGIFVNIYWMLIANVIIGVVSFFINTTYSGKRLNYSSWTQLKDISPSLGISLIMFIPVLLLSFIPLSPFIIFPLQLIVGAVITLILCETSKLPEYIELKDVVLSYRTKFIKK